MQLCSSEVRAYNFIILFRFVGSFSDFHIRVILALYNELKASSSILRNSWRSLGIDSPVWENFPVKPQVLPARGALGSCCCVAAAPHRSPLRSPAFPPMRQITLIPWAKPPIASYCPQIPFKLHSGMESYLSRLCL